MSEVGARGPSSCPPLEVIELIAAGGAVDAGVRRHVDACGVCGALVAQARADNALVAEVAGAHAPRTAASGGAAAAGGVPVIAGYTIVDELHRGGQGVVYRAEQVAAKRMVAVKMLLAGGLSSTKQLARFEREVELVASLRHPGIVTLYESGVSAAGEPYLAMELVDGVGLLDFVTLLPDRAGVRGREWARPMVELFARICEATAYAHRRGVIHRDLKPGNILVDESGMPRLLDFGIAKATGGAGAGDAGASTTLAGEFVGTFRYAAPEQVSGDPESVDTRADIYALGVMLFEALTRSRAYELKGSIRQVVETITNTVPPRASAVNPLVDDELDAIVGKALAKEPSRRYQTAEAMGSDLAAYLEDRPVSARGETTMYVLGKLVRRHRVGLVLSAVALVAAVGGLSVLGLTMARLGGARQNLSDLIGPLRQIDWETSRVAIADIDGYLLEVERLVDERLGNDPKLRAEVASAIGLAAVGRNDLATARARLEQALGLERSRGGTSAEVRAAEVEHNLGRVLWNMARDPAMGDRSALLAEADGHYRSALAARRALLGGKDARTADTMHHLASTLYEQERAAEALPLFDEAIAVLGDLGKDHEAALANVYNGKGVCLKHLGKLDEALASFQLAVEHISRAEGESSWRTGAALHSCARCLADVRRFDEAVEMMGRAVSIKEAALGAEHQSTQLSKRRLEEIRAEAVAAEGSAGSAVSSGGDR